MCAINPKRPASTDGNGGRVRFLKSCSAVTSLLFLFSLVLSSYAWEDWKVADSATRFRIARPCRLRQSFTLRMDVAEPFSGQWVAGAFAADGTELQFRSVRQGKKLLAVEIFCPAKIAGPANYAGSKDKTGFPDHSPIFLYLSTGGADKKNPISVSKPISCFSKNDKSITRPSTPGELFAYWSCAKPVTFRGDLSVGENLGKRVSRGDARQTRRGNPCTRVFAGTSLFVTEKTEFRFGVRSRGTAWFVFVDGEGVAAWGDADNTVGAVLGRKVVLQPGIHDYSLVAISRAKESFPEAVFSINGKQAVPLSEEMLVASHLPIAVRLESRDGTVHPGASFTSSALSLPKMSTECHDVEVQDLTVTNEKSSSTQFALAGQKPAAKTSLAVAGSPPQKLVLSGNFAQRQFSVRLPVFPQQTAKIIMPELFVETLPLTVLSGKNCELGIKILNSSLRRTSDEAKTKPVLKIELNDSNGKIMSVGSKRFNSLNSTLKITIPVTKELSSITLSAWMEGVRITPPIAVGFVRPGSDLSRLRAVGDRLFNGKETAVLCVDEVIPDTVSGLQKTKKLPVNSRLIWVDTYVDMGSGIETMAPFPAGKTVRRQFSISRLDCRYLPSLPVLPELWKFHLGALAIEKQPDAVIWGIGVADLAAGVHRDEIRRRNQFLIQACQLRHIQPIMVTPPPMPDIAHEEGRIAALSLKRLGLHLGIPVVDVYSEAHALKSRTGQMPFESFSRLDGVTGLNGMNEAGKNWYMQLLVRVVSTIIME